MTSDYRIPAPLQNTIDNLSFLARTQEGEKLFFKEKIHLLNSDWGARFRRYYYNENFDSQKKIIKEIVENGLDSLNTYRGNIHYSRLVHEFKRAKDGICNLRNTYFKQLRETGELDTVIYMMEQQISACDNELMKDRQKYIEDADRDREYSSNEDL
tara:strand:- start:3041 stop:3508 length:468 start_codon:yes stop_codon:yes gene_type:complete